MQELCYLRGVRGLAPASSVASRSVGWVKAPLFTRMPLPFTRDHENNGAYTRRCTQKAACSRAGVLIFKGGAGAGPRVEP